jgi:hypothetical protein
MHTTSEVFSEKILLPLGRTAPSLMHNLSTIANTGIKVQDLARERLQLEVIVVHTN